MGVTKAIPKVKVLMLASGGAQSRRTDLLLDSGAEFNYMSKALARELNLHILKEEKTVTTVTGETKSMGKVQARIHIKNRRIELEFLVVATRRVETALGWPTMQTHVDILRCPGRKASKLCMFGINLQLGKSSQGTGNHLH